MNDKTALRSVSEAAPGTRFVLVDALRGIAAVSVLFHHLLFHSELQQTLWHVLPTWFAEYCHQGALGVEIFFVLSGFVITHSLRNVTLTPRTVGNFILRRQLRLDPPYWALLTLTILGLYAESHVAWIRQKYIPTRADIVTNFLYLHDLTSNHAIMRVAWTLCLEVQFYLVFIVLLLAAKLLSPAESEAGNLSAILVGGSGVVSMLIPAHFCDAWFIQWWYYFAAGALCYWAANNERFRVAFIGFLLFLPAIAIGGAIYGFQDARPILTGWATAVLLYTAGRMGKLTRWLDFAPLQYLGRISYSLYLSHVLVGIYIMRLGFRLTATNGPAAVGWFIFAAGAAIGGAHLVYLAVEQPSIRFAARFKLTEGKDPAALGAALLGEIPCGIPTELPNT
jgi:peptidoglycan/LPS O-acetylase OafA/YrhL